MRSIFITGGNRGIGRAIAMRFAAPGVVVAIAARDEAALHETAGGLRQSGAATFPIRLDVTDESSVRSAFDAYRAKHDSLDVLVNNAGIGGGEPIVNSDVSRWRRTIETNLVGMYLVSRQAVPLMRDGGRIINIASVLGRFGVAGYTAYCAAKHGVIGFTRALALELAARRITVNALCPGWVETELALQGMLIGATAAGKTYEAFRRRALDEVPIKRIIQPEEVAGLVYFLSSEEAAPITGQTYNICGGQTMD